MSTTAIIMMVLFMVIIWGGLILSTIALRSKPDEKVGLFGASPYATDSVLIEQEFKRD
ncbi:putative membrane protein [Corynebacterium deserti GIMN1.010]|uniref:Putative membrane protein n=1 Tax=Corynebacterium deserti GIMN1.010 TaxID=931089 RepID=A0A0M4CIP2_9CORY|nr:methionine/alanine import NSS transporter subunit MetS [Corynebacterium deserti]ALC05438.1 putative membrane protein [Corynebacterium deserti GIMN1.010]